MDSKIWMPLAVAAVITIAVRLTVFGDDCNLLVVGMTFVGSSALCLIALRVIDFFIHKTINRSDRQ